MLVVAINTIVSDGLIVCVGLAIKRAAGVNQQNGLPVGLANKLSAY